METCIQVQSPCLSPCCSHFKCIKLRLSSTDKGGRYGSPIPVLLKERIVLMRGIISDAGSVLGRRGQTFFGGGALGRISQLKLSIRKLAKSQL